MTFRVQGAEAPGARLERRIMLTGAKVQLVKCGSGGSGLVQVLTINWKDDPK